MSIKQVEVRRQRSQSQRWNFFYLNFTSFRDCNTPVWIHRSLRNGAKSLKCHTRGFLLFFPWSSVSSNFQVTRAKKLTIWIRLSPIGPPLKRFWTITPVSIHTWLWNDSQSFGLGVGWGGMGLMGLGGVGLKVMGWSIRDVVFYCFSGSSARDRDNRINKVTSPIAAIKYLRFALVTSCLKYEQAIENLRVDMEHN